MSTIGGIDKRKKKPSKLQPIELNWQLQGDKQIHKQKATFLICHLNWLKNAKFMILVNCWKLCADLFVFLLFRPYFIGIYHKMAYANSISIRDGKNLWMKPPITTTNKRKEKFLCFKWKWHFLNMISIAFIFGMRTLRVYYAHWEWFRF